MYIKLKQNPGFHLILCCTSQKCLLIIYVFCFSYIIISYITILTYTAQRSTGAVLKKPEALFTHLWLYCGEMVLSVCKGDLSFQNVPTCLYRVTELCMFLLYVWLKCFGVLYSVFFPQIHSIIQFIVEIGSNFWIINTSLVRRCLLQ